MKALRTIFAAILSLTLSVIVFLPLGAGLALAQSADLTEDNSATARVIPQDTYADVYVTPPDSYTGLSLTIKYGTSRTALGSSASAVSNGTEFYGGLTHLAPKTLYYYEAFSGIDGSALMSTPLVFTTNDSVAGATVKGGVVTSLAVTGITQNEATVKGTVANATNTLEILTDTTGNGSFDSSTVPSVQNDKTFTFKISNLKPGTVYHIVAVKLNDSTVRLSDVQAFSTLPVSVLPYVSAVDDTSATVSAEITGDTSPAVYYGKDTNSMTSKVQMTADAGNPGLYTAPLEDLDADTGYYYKIGSSDGKTFYTSSYSLLTLPAGTDDKPPVVPTITDQGSGSAGISYDLKVLVQCGQDGPLISGKQACGFPEFIALISRIIDFLLFLVAPIIATVLLLYHGLMILTSGGNTEKLAAAKGALLKVVIGFALACGAWIIVKFVMVQLGVDTTVFPAFYTT